MIKYYLHDGEKQLGGFEKEELKKYEIKQDTPIWYESLEEWTTAGEIEDLKDIIVKEPPRFKYSNTNKNSNDDSFYKKNKYYLLTLLGLLIVILSIIIIKTSLTSSLKNENAPLLKNSSINDSSNQEVKSNKVDSSSKNQNKSIEDIKKDLVKSEQNSPLKFITIDANDKPNKVRTRHGTFFRSSKYEIDGVLIEGFIYSNATLAVFKDIVYKVNYISDTGTVISSEEFTIYDFLTPNSSLEIKQKVYPPNGTSVIQYKVIRASFD